MKLLRMRLLRIATVLLSGLIVHGAYGQTLSGHVSPARVYQLDPGVSGKVKSVSVQEGQRVLPGTLLLDLESSYFAAQLEAAAAQTAFRKAEMEEVSRSFERDTALFDEGSLSAVELDLRKIEMLAATAAYRHSVAEQLGFERKLDASKVFAPVAGMMVERNVDPGQWINLNESRQSSIVFVSSEPVVHAVAMPDQLKGLSPGAAVTITFDDGSAEGTVASIDSITLPGQLLLTVRADGSLPSIGHAVELTF